VIAHTRRFVKAVQLMASKCGGNKAEAAVSAQHQPALNAIDQKHVV
jgi:hypothetical protein